MFAKIKSRLFDKKKDSKEKGSFESKTFHFTLHKIENLDLDFWLQKLWTVRENVVGAMVAIEESHDENKALHAHLLVQFTTARKFSRSTLLKYFQTESLQISPKKGQDAICNVMGYLTKSGNYKIKGNFYYRETQLSLDPLVLNFEWKAKGPKATMEFFKNLLEDRIAAGEKHIMSKLWIRGDSIGYYLQLNPTVLKTLEKLENALRLEQNREKVSPIELDSNMSVEALKEAYLAYLKEFPDMFIEKLPKQSPLRLLGLEKDYADHVEHDLNVIKTILESLKIALKYGPKRPHKSLNLHLWSSQASFGKTRLLKALQKRFVTYRLPNDQYFLDYENDKYSLLVSDEAEAYLKTKSQDHIKLILEGEMVEFNRKGLQKILKEDNPLVILTANRSFFEIMKRCFKKAFDFDALFVRVLDLEIKSRATLHFIIDRILKIS